MQKTRNSLAAGLTLSLLAAALPATAQGPAGLRTPEERCQDRVHGRLYAAALTDPGHPDFPAYRDWLCTRRFDTHNQALAAGLPVGANVYGFAVEPGRSFPPEAIEGWRTAQCSKDAKPEQVAEADLRFRDLADGDVLEEVRSCLGRGDLECSATVQGDVAVFHARYVAPNRDTTIEALALNGAAIEADGWRHGDALDERGRSYAHALPAKSDELQFELETRLDHCRAIVEKHTIRKETNAHPKRANGARRRR